MFEKEEIVVIPDLFDPEEKLVVTPDGFGDWFAKRGWPQIHRMTRTVWREDAERVPHPRGDRLRQLVSNVLVFLLPEELGEKLAVYKPEKDWGLLREVEENAVLFATQKLKGSGEKRLHGKIAAGLGGHVERMDIHAKTPSPKEWRETPYLLDFFALAAARRELTEEINLPDVDLESRIWQLGVINSSYGEVESLHLGLVHVLALIGETPTIKETEKLQAVRIPLREMKDYLTREDVVLDHWTRLIFQFKKSTLAHHIALSAQAKYRYKQPTGRP